MLSITNLGILGLLLVVFVVIRKLTKRKKLITSESTILITGGCMGLGREVALLFASNNRCNIVIYDIRADLADELIKDIQDRGGKAHFYECDISDRQAILKTFSDTLKRFPKIDILVNNAGIVINNKFEDLSDDQAEYAMKVNFLGPFILTKQVLSLMKLQGSGHIATIASIASHIYNLDVSIYTASKGALFNMFSTLRLELKRDKSPIKTTLVCPWVINTGMFHGFKVKFTFFGLLDFLGMHKVATKIYQGILYEQEEVYLPFYHQIVFRVILMLPSWFSDILTLWLGKIPETHILNMNR